MTCQTALPASSEKISSLQYLRGGAAVSVALLHTLNIVKYVKGSDIPFYSILSGGVDLFFVISGFIMYTTVTRKRQTVPEFIWNRFTRIVPLYWLFTIIFVPVALKSTFYSQDLSPTRLAESLLFIPYGHGPVLGVGWTLEYELFFYVLLAATIVINRNRIAELSSGIYLLLVLLGTFLTLSSAPAIYYTRPIILEFLFGIAIAKVYSTPLFTVSKVTGFTLIAVGLSAFFVSAVVGASNRGDSQPLVMGLPASLLVIGALGLERSGVSFQKRVYLLIGDASYSIYLTHTFVVVLAAFILKLPFVDKNTFGLIVFSTATVMLAVVAGIIIHKTVERPLIALFRNVFHPVAAQLRANSVLPGDAAAP